MGKRIGSLEKAFAVEHFRSTSAKTYIGLKEIQDVFLSSRAIGWTMESVAFPRLTLIKVSRGLSIISSLNGL